MHLIEESVAYVTAIWRHPFVSCADGASFLQRHNQYRADAYLGFLRFPFHLYQEDDISSQYASIMNRFLSLLENGEFRTHREVTWYADKLCVTAKYLSEVSKKVSGYPANFWLNRYTSVEISRLLRDKSLSFVAISDMLGFSSPAYFSRYVTHNLGL